MKQLFYILFLSTSSWAQSSFPNEWIGDYYGQMIIANQARPNDTVPVNFGLHEIEKDSIWSYTMTYNSEKFGAIVKDYQYVRVQKDDNVNFIFDEKNGIIMELTLMNDCFYGMYEVMGMIYTTSFRKLDNSLMFELFASPTKDPKISKTINEGEANESSIEAKSYKPTLVQSVILKKK